MAWEQTEEAIKSCTDCPLSEFYLDSGFSPLLGRGNKTAQYLIILEKPSKDDMLTQEIAYDHLGTLLDKLLNAAGFKKEDYYITSLFKCYCKGFVSGQAEKCMKHWQSEKELIKPSKIIVFSKAATKFLKKHKINATIFPSLHYIYNQGLIEHRKVVAELRKVKLNGVC
jgi:uracil-DNA glycosylase family 4